MVKYDTPAWGVALAHDELNGGAAGSFFGQPAGTRPSADYGLSRRTSLYALVGHVANERNAAYSITASELVGVPPRAGHGQSGVMLGIRHTF